MKLVDQIIDYENGDLDFEETIALFQSLIDNGQAWTLQGHYGRTAHDLIEAGYCTLGPERVKDYYGNLIPSKDDIEPGKPGSQQFVDLKANSGT